MSTSNEKAMMIDKEQIIHLKFPNEEVLENEDAILNRKSDCERATVVGNAEKNKVKIIFEDSDGLKMTETTIWGNTEKRIILKGGVVIPLNRIHEIKLF